MLNSRALDDVAAALWRAESVDAGAPESVTARRTRDAFDDQSEGTKDRLRKFARHAAPAVLTASMPEDVKGLIAEWKQAAEGVTPGPWQRKALGGSSTVLTPSMPPRNDRRSEVTYGYQDNSQFCIAFPFLYQAEPGKTDERTRMDFVCFGHADAAWIARCSPAGIHTLLAALASLSAKVEELTRDNIVAPAECGANCDDPHCHYSHHPLTLRQAYENSLERLRCVETSLAEMTALKDEIKTAHGASIQDGNRLRKELAERDRIIAEKDKALAALRRKVPSERWYWPEDDTSSDACADNPREALEQLMPGRIAAYSCGGIAYTNYYGWLPAAEDADSDDDFEVDEPTLEAATEKMQAEIERRAARDRRAS